MLKQKIQEDLSKAMKGGEKISISVLRLLLASILNKEKEKRYKLIKAEPELEEKPLQEKAKLSEQELVEIIFSEIKKRKEAILGFEKGKRQDLVKKERAELEILEKYLPEQLSEQEIKEMANQVIADLGAKDIKDMGKVMAQLMPKLKGKAEGSAVSEIVKELLMSVRPGAGH